MSIKLEIEAEKLNSLDPILQKIVSDAVEKSKEIAKELEEKKLATQKSKILGWKERQANRKTEERKARVKSGVNILNSFVQEVSRPFLNLCNRDDFDKFKNLRISFIPGKSDQASGSSVAILDGGKRVSTIYKSNLQQMEEREERVLSKLKDETCFTGSPIEMMEEIARLQLEVSDQKRGRDSRMFVCQAAQEAALAWSENKEIDQEMEKLLNSFQK